MYSLLWIERRYLGAMPVLFWLGVFSADVVLPLQMALMLPSMILALLYVSFNSIRDAFAVLSVLTFGIAGGVLALLVSRTPFSISAAVGFASVIGVATLGGLVFVAGAGVSAATRVAPPMPNGVVRPAAATATTSRLTADRARAPRPRLPMPRLPIAILSLTPHPSAPRSPARRRRARRAQISSRLVSIDPSQGRY